MIICFVCICLEGFVVKDLGYCVFVKKENYEEVFKDVIFCRNFYIYSKMKKYIFKFIMMYIIYYFFYFICLYKVFNIVDFSICRMCEFCNGLVLYCIGFRYRVL